MLLFRALFAFGAAFEVPIVTYLVSLACYDYTTFSHWYTPLGGGDPMEVQTWAAQPAPRVERSLLGHRVLVPGSLYLTEAA